MVSLKLFSRNSYIMYLKDHLNSKTETHKPSLRAVTGSYFLFFFIFLFFLKTNLFMIRYHQNSLDIDLTTGKLKQLIMKDR